MFDNSMTGAVGFAMHEARLILSTLEGALLVARTYEDPARFKEVACCLLEKLKKR